MQPAHRAEDRVLFKFVNSFSTISQLDINLACSCTRD